MHSTYTLSQRLPLRLERTLFDFAGILLALLLLSLLSAAGGWYFWHVQRIYTGVSVGGVPVGGMTRAAALETLAQRLAAAPMAPITLHYAGQHWPVRLDQVQMQADLLTAVNAAYRVGRQGNFSARTVEQLFTLVRGADIAPPLTVDEAQLQAAIAQIAQEVRRPGRAASQLGDLTIPALPALEVDVAATTATALALIQRGALNQAVDTPLQVIEETPVVTDAPQPAASTTTPTFRPLIARAEEFGLHFAIDPATLTRLLPSVDPLQINETALRDLVESWATQIDLPPRDARLRFNPDTGGLAVLQDSDYGRQLDVEATFAALKEALLTGGATANLTVVKLPPAVDADRIAEMGIRELVASGTTYFRGSSAERIRNIEVAAEQFEGVVIPPDGIFSFNEIVESVTSANGFEDSLVIWGDQTVVGVGGGVCQVSTTIFRAAYNAGLPIVERYNHGYIVDWYGEPGMDATIFTPSVDFKFRNDTGAYLLIEPVVDSVNGEMTFLFYGTKPDRVVTIGAPVKSEIKEPEPPLYTVDESLAPEAQKQVEWEKPGMTVTVQRTIVENGTTRTDTLTSRYVPWRAQYIVGPGVAIPATPTPTAEAEATPEATPTP